MSVIDYGESDLVKRDQKIIWHPYTQHGLGNPILPVASARGAYLKLTDGREILDGISSWWVNLHGHSHPEVSAAIHQQANQLEHVIFAGFTHEPAVKLAETLVAHPANQRAGFSRVFYSDNGSTAVEVALKMAYQFHLNQGDTRRDRFIALHHSYHGDTFGAMAVGEPKGFHQKFSKLMTRVDFVDPENLEQLDELLKEGDRYAAIIFEPLVQACSGMRMHSAAFLEKAIEKCRAHGILAISDEIFTGFYRTGRCFAFEYTDCKPDFMCLSKGITGGFLPLAVTLTSERIYQAFLSNDVGMAFLHGHSYTANPLACAAALASWKILNSQECQTQLEMIGSRTHERIKKLASHPLVRSARSLGTIGAIELKREFGYLTSTTRSPSALLSQFAIERGVLLRPLGNVIYTLPPYCVTADELDRIFNVMLEMIVFSESLS